MSSKPSVIILGGLNASARALGLYLVPEGGDSLVSHIRFVDKYSVQPPTTFLGKRFTALLKNPIVDYLQANLTKEIPVQKAFEPPEGVEPFSYVFDFTGQVHISRTSVDLHIEQTAVPAFLIGKEASTRKVKAYIRITPPFYKTTLEKVAHKESDMIKPEDPAGVWYHEALRILASFSDLNLVIIRHGLVYGPTIVSGIITPLMLLGLVYKEMDEEFKSLWSPNVRFNTLHVDDLAAACWAAAEWMAKNGREEANKVAGESIYFSNDKSKVANVQGAPDPSAELIAPLFNLVDDSDTTLRTLGSVLTQVYGIRTGFHSLLHNTLAQMKTEEALEEINETHIEAWSRILSKASPSVDNTPLSPYMEAFMLEKRSFAYNGDKIKKILGYQLKHPTFGSKTVQETIDYFKEEGIWPNVQWN